MTKTSRRQLYRCQTVEDTLELGRTLAKRSKDGTLISLRGPLGAGKTILAKGIAEELGITEAVTSPTFTLVQDYEGPSLCLHHLDLYRIDGPEEFEGVGGEELLHTGGVTVVEWSERIESLLPADTVKVEIEIEPDGCRRIAVEDFPDEHTGT